MNHNASSPYFSELKKRAAELLLERKYIQSTQSYAQIFVQAPDDVDTLGFNFRISRLRQKRAQEPSTNRLVIVSADQLGVLKKNLGNLAECYDIFVLHTKQQEYQAKIATDWLVGQSVKFLLLEDAADIRSRIFGAVLDDPRGEVCIFYSDFFSLVCATYYRLVWAANCTVLGGASVNRQDPENLAAAAKSLPRRSDGLLDVTTDHCPKMSAALETAALFLVDNIDQQSLLSETLSKTSDAVFQALDGWRGLRNHVHARRSNTADAATPTKPLPEGAPAPRARIPTAVVAAKSIREELLRQLDEFRRLYPATPYYDRLYHIVDDCGDPIALTQIRETLYHVDQRRQGQVPYLGTPLVSIIMPAFNREGLIAEAIKSVLAQSVSSFELIICDDASSDKTVKVVESFKDKRIRLIRQKENKGAATARNKALETATGDVIAYLDSDNIWHPRYLELVLEQVKAWPGQLAVYAGFFDLRVRSDGKYRLLDVKHRPFHLEDQLEKPFVDLNSFAHSRRLYDTLGGFDERLARRQDYDLISRYCWSREPQVIPYVLNIYQRLDNENQITTVQRDNTEPAEIIREKIKGYYAKGLPAKLPPWLKKVSVISWDMSRNHFAKAYCVAEALSEHVEVELISFSFFEEGVFQPLADVNPKFETKYFSGGTFPEFFDNYARGIAAITGDAIYAVKPRLTSFGMGLMANYHTGKPLMLEMNDLETVVGSAKAKDSHVSFALDAVFDQLEKAKTPYELIWSQVLDPLVTEIPTTFTHNINLNIHYQNRSLYMRNIKNESLYDPAAYDRDTVRKDLGFRPDDRVILFGGLVRKHKGIFELIELIEKLGDTRYKLLVVGSRETPDLKRVSAEHGDKVVILGPQPPERMAAINYAADLVILWFDPNVPAGNYQSPYKMSDALAMGPSIIGSPTSDLADFARRELLWTVPFGDQDALVAKIHEVFADPAERLRRQHRARAFFLREFSYKSVLPAFALGASALEQNRVYPVAERFAKFFAEFEKRARQKG